MKSSGKSSVLPFSRDEMRIPQRFLIQIPDGGERGDRGVVSVGVQEVDGSIGGSMGGIRQGRGRSRDQSEPNLLNG